MSEHGIVAPLDNFLGCHDLSSFPAKGIVGAACGEQAQVWNIDPSTGLPDTENPRWSYDQPNVDFWHSATFSWDGKVANFIDESFGDGCPTVTTKTGGLPGGPRVFETGNMFFFDTRSGELLSEYRNPRPTNDNTSPTTGKYCSSHLGIPVPSRDRYLLVNAYYRGGSAVIDFTDPTKPKEIAFADLDGTNTWSAYTYPRKWSSSGSIPVYSNDGLSRNYGTAANPSYPEAAYGFQRFQAKVGKTRIVGLNHLNPQLQDRFIPTKIATPKAVRRRAGEGAVVRDGQARGARRAQQLGAAVREVGRPAEGPRERALRQSHRRHSLWAAGPRSCGRQVGAPGSNGLPWLVSDAQRPAQSRSACV